MYIYKTVNNINGKIYIGLQTHNRKDYIGSGVLIKKAIKKYGRASFSKEIVERCENIEELNKREQFWIKEYNSLYPNGYNISKGGGNGEHNRIEISEDILNFIINSYKSGQTLVYISEQTNLSLTKIQNELKLNSIEIKKRKHTNEQKHEWSLKYTKDPAYFIPLEKQEQLINLFNNGEKYSEIAKAINETYENVVKYLKKIKLKKLKRKKSLVGKYDKNGSNNPNYKKVDEALTKNIINDFTSKNLKIEELSKKYKIPYKRIRRILIENNLKIKKGPRVN